MSFVKDTNYYFRKIKLIELAIDGTKKRLEELKKDPTATQLMIDSHIWQIRSQQSQLKKAEQTVHNLRHK